MEQEKYLRLIYRQWQKALSSEEERELHAWLADSPDNQKVEEEVYQSLELMGDYEPSFDVDVKSDFGKVQ